MTELVGELPADRGLIARPGNGDRARPKRVGLLEQIVTTRMG